MCIELGVPFSRSVGGWPVDPSRDGASDRRGRDVAGAIAAVAELRARGEDVAIVLFGYYNPIFALGVSVFAERAATAGVDAVLAVDLPIDELAELRTRSPRAGVAVMPLVAPTSTPDRIARLAGFAPPFVYYISMTGVTGTRAAAAVDPVRLAQIRLAAGAPVAIGFGIRTAADARRFSPIADGVVVGSALVDRLANDGVAGVTALVRELAGAMAR